MGIPVLDVVNLARVLKRAAVVVIMSPWLWFSALASSVSLIVYALYDKISELLSTYHTFIGDKINAIQSGVWDVIVQSNVYTFIIYSTGSDLLWSIVKFFVGQVIWICFTFLVGVFGLVLWIISKKFVSWLGQFFMEV